MKTNTLLKMEGEFEKLARIMSKNYGVKVQIGGTACCFNGSTIFLPGNADQLSARDRMLLHAKLDHERGHASEEIQARDTKRPGPLALSRAERDARVRMMFNVFEDIRIEAKMSAVEPGTAENLRSLMKDAVQRHKAEASKPSANPWHAIGCGIIFAASGEECSWLRPEISAMVALLDSEICQAKRAKTPEDAMDLARQTVAKIQGQVDRIREENRKAEERKEQEKKAKAKKDAEPQPSEPSEPEEGEGEEGDESGEGSEASEGEEESAGDKAEGEEEEAEGSPKDAEGEEEEGESEESEPSADAGGEAEESAGDQGEDSDEGSQGESEKGEGAEGEGEVESEGGDPSGEAGEGETKGEEKPEPQDLGSLDQIEDEPEVEDLTKAVEDALKKSAEEDLAAHGENRWVVDPRVQAEDTINQVKVEKSASRRYQALRDQLSSQINFMRTKLRNTLRTRSMATRSPDQERGELDEQALYSLKTGNTRVFASKVPGETVDTAVMILIDESGSMGNGCEERRPAYHAKLAAIALGETLSAIQVPFEMIGFTNVAPGKVASEVSYADSTRCWPFEYDLFKSYEQAFEAAKLNLLAITGKCENVDGEALMFAARRLAARPEARKILLVLSDGSPAGGADYRANCWYLGEAIRTISKAGVEVIGAGFGAEGASAVQEYYTPENGAEALPIPPKEMASLGQKLVTLMTRKLGKGKQR